MKGRRPGIKHSQGGIVMSGNLEWLVAYVVVNGLLILEIATFATFMILAIKHLYKMLK
jgi:hypothetical protein